YCVNPREDERRSPRWRGLSASRLSINLRLKGAAACTSCGSSSDANVVPPWAIASPILFTASWLNEHPPVAASAIAAAATPAALRHLACMLPPPNRWSHGRSGGLFRGLRIPHR